MGKNTKKAEAKRVPFNWARLKKMWDEGKSYLEMAKALDAHFNPEGDDPTKSIRAKCSVSMNRGVKIDGKVVKFARREKATKEPTSKKAPAKKATPKKVSKPTPKKSKPKAIPKPSMVPQPEEPKPQPET